MSMNRAVQLAFALALLFCPARAEAHAHLKHSEPAGGSRIASSPQLIRLWFSERPELSMTAVSLKDSNGKELPLAMLRIDPDDPLVVSVGVGQLLPPGRYTVTWRTAASDGHPSHGSFSFVVLGGGGVR